MELKKRRRGQGQEGDEKKERKKVRKKEGQKKRKKEGKKERKEGRKKGRGENCSIIFVTLDATDAPDASVGVERRPEEAQMSGSG